MPCVSDGHATSHNQGQRCLVLSLLSATLERLRAILSGLVQNVLDLLNGKAKTMVYNVYYVRSSFGGQVA